MCPIATMMMIYNTSVTGTNTGLNTQSSRRILSSLHFLPISSNDWHTWPNINNQILCETAPHCVKNWKMLTVHDSTGWNILTWLPPTSSLQTMVRWTWTGLLCNNTDEWNCFRYVYLSSMILCFIFENRKYVPINPRVFQSAIRFSSISHIIFDMVDKNCG